jgi:hypothetical protein
MFSERRNAVSKCHLDEFIFIFKELRDLDTNRQALRTTFLGLATCKVKKSYSEEAALPVSTYCALP